MRGGRPSLIGRNDTHVRGLLHWLLVPDHQQRVFWLFTYPRFTGIPLVREPARARQFGGMFENPIKCPILGGAQPTEPNGDEESMVRWFLLAVSTVQVGIPRRCPKLALLRPRAR